MEALPRAGTGAGSTRGGERRLRPGPRRSGPEEFDALFKAEIVACPIRDGLAACCVDESDPACLEDDPDGDGVATLLDNCPRVANAEQEDRNGDGVGDACQCGDVNESGTTDSVDAFMIARGEVSSSGPGFSRCDVDGNGLCDVADALMIARGEVGSSAGGQLCPAYVVGATAP